MRLLAIFSLVAICSLGWAKPQAEFYQYKLPGIDGKPIDLSSFQGRVVMVVNTASQCGYTDQYAGLQKLHDEFAAKGLTIIGVPSRSFKQEYKDEAKVAKFCKMRYGVSFPLTKILAVKGGNAHPLFHHLIAQAPQRQGEAVKWNFEKFLVSRQGQVKARFPSKIEPTSDQVRDALQKLL